MSIVPPVNLLLLKVEKQAAALVPIFVVVATQTKRATAQLHDADEDSQQVAEIAEGLEIAIRQGANVRRETQAQQIERIDVALGVREPNEIDGARAAFDQGLQRGVRAFLRKIAKKRIAGAERQKTECDALLAFGAFINAVDDFMRGAIATDGDKAAIALFVRLAGKFDGVTGPGRSENVNLQPFSRRPARAGPASLAERPPPAAGLTIAKK